MSLVVCAVLAALALGALRGGSLDALGALPLRRLRLVVLAALSQLAGTVAGGPLHGLGLAVSAALLVWFLAANRGLRGTGLVALGLLANALVITANGAMPVSERAAARAGVLELVDGAGLDSRHELAGPGTRLAWLGDVVPVPLPLRPEVVSAGDVLVAAGLAQLVTLGMRPASSPTRSAPARPPSPRPRPTAAGVRRRRSASRSRPS